MKYEKIYPLGERKGIGSYETFFNQGKFKSIKEAIEANEYCVVDFVKDEQGIIYFEIYTGALPDVKTYHRLNIQHFPCGVDVMDDNDALRISFGILDMEYDIAHKPDCIEETQRDIHYSLETPLILNETYPVSFGEVRQIRMGDDGFWHETGVKAVEIDNEIGADLSFNGHFFKYTDNTKAK